MNRRNYMLLVALAFFWTEVTAQSPAKYVAHKRTAFRAAGGYSLVANGDLESYTGTQDNGVTDSFTAWTVDDYSGSYADSSATVHAGSGALKLSRGGSGFEALYQQGGLLASVTPLASLTLRFWQRGNGSANAGHFAVYDLSNAAYVFDLQVGDTGSIITGVTYAEVVKAFTVPSGCTSIRVYFYLDIAVDNAVIYIDDVSVQ